MKKLDRWLLATIGFLLPWVVAAQTSITGTVVDARTQSAIIGAAISIKTVQGGGMTSDLEGHFSLETQEELPVILVVSYIGYDDFEMDIFEAESPLLIELNENTFKLNEVVVVGYGTQKRENLSTSVASLGQNSLKDMATQSFESVLAGKASGVSLTTPSGAVGTAPIVRVRGVNSITSGTQPLYVIDGIPMIAGNQSYGGDSNALADINPADIVRIDILKDHGRAINTSTQVQQYTWTNTVQYDGTLAEKHHFSLLAGTEVFEKKLTRWGAMRTDLLDQDYSIYEAAYNNAYATGNRITENGLLSYLVRINYDWDSRYILSLNGRRDGFSALSHNHRWGNFGGVSAAWTLSEEPFFEPLRKRIFHLKLRAGWGVVGNTNVGDYAAYSYYLNSYYGDSGAYTIGQVADSENLKWESSRKLDVGVEATLFNKLDVELGYYDTRSSDLILAVPVSPSKGIPGNSITTNAGAVKNNGIELNLSMDLISRKHFTWHTSLDFSTNHNVVTSLGNAESLMDANAPCATNITVVGQSVGQLYLYHAGGVDPETGRRILYGKNGEEVLLMFEKQGQFFTRDGKLFSQSDLEKHVCGNVLPTWFGGWNHDFRWRQFDLNLFFQFSGGNKIFNGTKGTLADGRFWNNAEEVYYDHWTEENRYATYAKPIYGDTYSNSGSSFPLDIWVERGDFLRLKNLTLGYSVPEKSRWLATVGVKKIRVYAQAQNLFVLTGYSGIDPEVTSNTNSYTLSGGTDYQTTPQSRTFLFGVNVSF